MAQQGNDNKGISSLKKKILFTLACLAVYRIGVHVPTPGVDGAAVSEFFNSQNRGFSAYLILLAAVPCRNFQFSLWVSCRTFRRQLFFNFFNFCGTSVRGT